MTPTPACQTACAATSCLPLHTILCYEPNTPVSCGDNTPLHPSSSCTAGSDPSNTVPRIGNPISTFTVTPHTCPHHYTLIPPMSWELQSLHSISIQPYLPLSMHRKGHDHAQASAQQGHVILACITSRCNTRGWLSAPSDSLPTQSLMNQHLGSAPALYPIPVAIHMPGMLLYQRVASGTAWLWVSSHT